MLGNTRLPRWLEIIYAKQHSSSVTSRKGVVVRARAHLLGPGRLVGGVDHVLVVVQLLLLGLPGLLLLLLLQGHQVGPLLLQLPLEPLRLTLLLDLLALVLLPGGGGGQRQKTGQFLESEPRIRKGKLEVTGRVGGTSPGGLKCWIPKDFL